jgi:pullulanase/glycogen debranching enzyme
MEVYMALVVNEILQDANLLEKTVAKYATEMADAGVSASMVEGAASDLAEKDKKKKQAVDLVAEKTALQNQIMLQGMDAINKIQSGAKSAFGKNKTITKEFHIGVDKPVTVKGMMRELVYIKDTATTYLTDLKKNGIKDADIAALDTIATDLKEADADQEQAKKLQVNATADRDSSLQVLKDLMTKIRNNAKVVFAKNENVLNEFSSILNTRNSKKAAPAPAPTVPPASPSK